MIWKELFPWANQELVELNIQSPKVLDRNVLISKSGFKGIEGDSTLTVLDRNYYCSIDYCTFFKCSSLGSYQKAGCVHMRLTGYGSVSITRTIGDSCQSSWEGNFGRLEVGEFGSIIVMMTSIDKCSPDSSIDSYHSLLFISGTQILRNINNTQCLAKRHAGYSNSLSASGSIDFCNLADNYMTQSCLHGMDGVLTIRRVNYIGNVMIGIYANYEGIITTNRGVISSRIILNDCVLIRNTGNYLINANNADVTLIGCCIDGLIIKENNGRVYNIDSRTRNQVTMTLMAGAGKHADIPYGEKTLKEIKNIKGIISMSLTVIK